MRNQNPTLVIMAAGMGSRFGGLKQIEPIDEQGHIIIDFSLFDAYRAGFRDVVFIIKKEIEQEFRERIGNRMEKWFRVRYVRQELNCLPEGAAVPEGRTKPWGTGHAVACCKGVVDGPFAVINADDFYGPTAFSAIYDFLAANTDDSQYAMVGYRVRNTVTEFGSVARGVCEVKNGLLTGITERTKIFKRGQDAAFTEDGETFAHLPGDTIVSMNLWGFSAAVLDRLWNGLPDFLRENLQKNPLKCEYFLPSVVNAQLEDGSARVKVLPCEETWYGVTYREDLESVVSAVRTMKETGIYPKELWK
ncbi:MAG: nucleotidyltransferase [Clostridia bacterium]|nr:nucleotidyltransferase [Clostridia bacterium]